GRQGEQQHDRRRHDDDNERVHERRLQRERPGCRMRHVAVAVEGQPLVQRLSCGVLLGLEARQQGPGEGKDPDQRNEPREDADADRDSPALADAESGSALHARSSSLNRLDSTRSANVAMMIAKMTTTMAYADADP